MQNRTSVRVQQRIPLGGPRSIDAMAEIFNLFNRTNYTLGTSESAPTQYLQPTAGEYRLAQFGFRVSF